MAAKRNQALDNWLDRSKAVNAQLAEDPEAREAAAAQAAAAGEDNRHIDPTDDEDGNPDAEAAPTPDAAADQAEADAARAGEEAREAAAAAAAEPIDAEAIAKELEKERQKAARFARDRDEGRRQLALERQRVADLQQRLSTPDPVAPAAAAEAKPKQDDPEPDAAQFPVEHDQWEIRQLRRDTQAALEEARATGRELAKIKEDQQREAVTNQFMSMMDGEKETFREDHPDFDKRVEWVKAALRKQARINGTPAEEVEAKIKHEESQFLGSKVREAQQLGVEYMGRYALEKLYEMADVYGYREDAAEAAQTHPAAPKNGKAAPDANAQIADRQKRAVAARTVTTMTQTPAQTHDPAAPMTAERFLNMSFAERQAYKKKEPNILERLFSTGEDSGVNPLLVGR